MAAPPPFPTSRAPWGDAAKGLLIVLVVFWHVVLKTYLKADWRLGIPLPGAWDLASDLIWPFLMPLFLFLSGYFASAALARPWAVVFRPRVVRFLYLYLLCLRGGGGDALRRLPVGPSPCGRRLPRRRSPVHSLRCRRRRPFTRSVRSGVRPDGRARAAGLPGHCRRHRR
ncbi:acyltransferase family protein [Microbacterium paraoxydans]|uniref:acyltransferase family protein n=2 Tax=Microbacterium TaxID=33882 RepID=UPI00135863C0